MALSESDKRILAAVEGGIPVGPAPFRQLAESAGCEEGQLLATLQRWLANGTLKRIGLVVRHHELGYRANAMVVWNIADDDVDRVAGLLSAEPLVTLCYRRPRQLPSWPYNLFCMIHGREEEEVRNTVSAIIRRNGLNAIDHDILFSRRRFKQRGARYCAPARQEVA